MQRKKIAVIGYGYVGQAFVRMVAHHYDVRVYDPIFHIDKTTEHVTFTETMNGFDDCILGVVCVPTPAGADGVCDSSLVEQAVEQLQTQLILIKSTVAPGTTERLKQKTGKRILFSPEYVGESSYFNPFFNTDMAATPFLIAGGADEDCNAVFDLLLPILGPTKTYYKTASLNAEIIKYMENAYFATKITFVNEMFNICRAYGADWHDVREGWLLDPRVEKMHTAVFVEKRGFAGKCLPKDTEALVQAAKQLGYTPAFLEQMIASNKQFRSENLV